MSAFTITRDAKRCISCNECFIVCPQSGENNPYSVIVPAEEKGEPPQVHRVENCIQCLTCADLCRSQAINFQGHHQVKRLATNQLIEAKTAKII